MDLETGVTARLKAASAVTAIVGAGTAAKVYWDVRPQGKPPPAIVLTQAGQSITTHLEGEDDMIVTRVQVDSLAMTKAEAKALAKAARAALLPEAAVGAGAGEVQFWGASSEGQRSGGDQVTEGYVHRVSEDFLMRHTAGN